MVTFQKLTRDWLILVFLPIWTKSVVVPLGELVPSLWVVCIFQNYSLLTCLIRVVMDLASPPRTSLSLLASRASPFTRLLPRRTNRQTMLGRLPMLYHRTNNQREKVEQSKCSWSVFRVLLNLHLDMTTQFLSASIHQCLLISLLPAT